MSDAQRRLLCRFALVACCAVPTFIAVNWVLFPRSIGQWQTHARHLMNCPVEIGRVETPTPNQLLFYNFRLSDAESPTPIEFKTVDWRQSLTTQQLELSDLDVNISQFTSLMRVLWEQVPRIELGTRQIELHLARISIRFPPTATAAGSTFVVKDCWIRIVPSGNKPRITVEFFTEQNCDNPIRWEAIFGNKELPTSWSLNTHDNALPCWLVSHVWPTAIRFGDMSWFKGFLSGELSKSRNTVDASSLQLLKVDPAKMLDAPHSTAAQKQSPSITLAPDAVCAILVQSAHVVDGRLQSLDCEVQCLQPGQIATRLLTAAKKWLHIDVPNSSSKEIVGFAQMAFQLEIRDGLLSIYGRETDGLIAVGNDRQPLIYATNESAGLAPYCLAGLLSDENQVQLPVSAAALEIMSHLPLLR